MDARQILLGRLGALEEDLLDAVDRLRTERVPPSIAKRVGADLIDSADVLLAKLGELRAKTDKLKDDGDTVHAANGLTTLWVLVDGLSVRVDQQLADMLALINGARSRWQSARHAKLAQLADHLIGELSDKLQAIAWKRFTFEAEGEAFAENTHIIRLRFPTRDIWNLPVAAHEFGHFLASQIRVPNDASRFVNVLGSADGVRPDKRWYFLNEYFADAVATYALGPAYPYSCLLLRFNPVRAWSDTDGKHPPDGHRAELILQILNRMDIEADSKNKFGGTVQKLKEFWRMALAASGVPLEASVETETEMDILADEIYAGILKPVVPRLRYNTLPTAFKRQLLLSDASSPLPENLLLTDLLNAAWRERLRNGVNASRVNDRLLTVCEQAGMVKAE